MKSKIPQNYKSTKLIEENAISLRKRSTLAEKEFWKMVRNRQLFGLKFRRQHPLDLYLADFYCHALKLVVEIDGKIHNKEEIKTYDRERELQIKQKGLKVVRFTNEEVLFNPKLIEETMLKLL